MPCLMTRAVIATVIIMQNVIRPEQNTHFRTYPRLMSNSALNNPNLCFNLFIIDNLTRDEDTFPDIKSATTAVSGSW